MVGWGSDATRCRRDLPGVFLNLRFSPVRMLRQEATGIRDDAECLLAAAGGNAGLCCVNMDWQTPDANVQSLLAVARGEWK